MGSVAEGNLGHDHIEDLCGKAGEGRHKDGLEVRAVVLRMEVGRVWWQACDVLCGSRQRR